MTIGIYRLMFDGIDKYYIGQSVNIEKRYSQHLNNFTSNKASPKLQEAYNLYGVPTLDILVVCSIEELDIEEEQSINIFNSVYNGFNTYKYKYEFMSFKGVDHGNSKYTKEQLLNAIGALTIIGNTINIVSKEYSVNKHTLSSIISGIEHLWIKEQYLDIILKARASLAVTSRNNKSKFCKNKLSIGNSNKFYPKIVDPKGNVFVIDNINEFAKINGTISKSSLHRLLSGQTTKTKGWTVCHEELL